MPSSLPLPTRFVVGGADDEMTLITHCLRAAGYTNIVEAAPGPRSEAQYASELTPEAGDVWIECAPKSGAVACATCNGHGEVMANHCPDCGGEGWLSGRSWIEAAGATRIDHHQPGDSGYGVAGFEGSSLGQVLRLLLEGGADPAALGLHPLDVGPFGADPGLQTASPQWGGVAHCWISGGQLWLLPREWSAVGYADHDPVAFATGRLPGFSAAEARAWLIARAVKAGRGATEADVVEALGMIEAAPTLPGYPLVYDLRGIPDLCPATLGADRQPVPGTGGRLGSAAFVAVLALPGRAALNWGAQGIRPAGRHLGLIGATGPDFREILASAGGVEIFGAPGKACGGYVPVAI